MRVWAGQFFFVFLKQKKQLFDVFVFGMPGKKRQVQKPKREKLDSKPIGNWTLLVDRALPRSKLFCSPFFCLVP